MNSRRRRGTWRGPPLPLTAGSRLISQAPAQPGPEERFTPAARRNASSVPNGPPPATGIPWPEPRSARTLRNLHHWPPLLLPGGWGAARGRSEERRSPPPHPKGRRPHSAPVSPGTPPPAARRNGGRAARKRGRLPGRARSAATGGGAGTPRAEEPRSTAASCRGGGEARGRLPPPAAARATSRAGRDAETAPERAPPGGAVPRPPARHPPRGGEEPPPSADPARSTEVPPEPPARQLPEGGGAIPCLRGAGPWGGSGGRSSRPGRPPDMAPPPSADPARPTAVPPEPPARQLPEGGGAPPCLRGAGPWGGSGGRTSRPGRPPGTAPPPSAGRALPTAAPTPLRLSVQRDGNGDRGRVTVCRWPRWRGEAPTTLRVPRSGVRSPGRARRDRAPYPAVPARPTGGAEPPPASRR